MLNAIVYENYFKNYEKNFDLDSLLEECEIDNIADLKPVDIETILKDNFYYCGSRLEFSHVGAILLSLIPLINWTEISKLVIDELILNELRKI